MKPPRPLLACLACLAWAAMLAPAASAPDAPAYRLAPDFFQFPEGLELGQVAGVAVDSRKRIILTHRGAQPVLIFDEHGRHQRSLGTGMLTGAHGTRVDAEDNIWVTDMRRHFVCQFSPSGKILRVLGESGTPGAGAGRFNRPTDVAFGPGGAFFVSDGYGNSRVAKFAADGGFLAEWGTPGAGRGEFHLPHGILADAEGFLHVADRENDRIQVFTQEGEWTREYGGFAPFGMCLSPGGLLHVADGRAHEVLVMTLHGEILARFGSEGEAPGQFRLPHGIALGQDGALYVTEIEGRRVQRFLPAPAAPER